MSQTSASGSGQDNGRSFRLTRRGPPGAGGGAAPEVSRAGSRMSLRMASIPTKAMGGRRGSTALSAGGGGGAEAAR